MDGMGVSALKAVRRPIRRGTNLVANLTAVTTDGDWTRYRWTKVPVLHAATADSHAGTNECSGHIHTYVYRHYPRDSEFFHRCIALAWCSDCRSWSSALVHVPRDQHLHDPLASLAPEERDRLHGSEHQLVKNLDRLAQRGELQQCLAEITSLSHSA